jgi:putative MATE family efflux protein
MGVAVAAQYSITKTFNDPLQRVTTSLVASTSKDERKEAISAVAILALLLGLLQVAMFGIPTEAVIRGMGVAADSAMFGPAVAYLRVRALGAPLGSLVLTLNGVCRGLGTARPPLYASLLATVVNIALDPLLIFGLGWGCAGAAVATVAAQLCGLMVLAFHLRAASRRGELSGTNTQAGLRWSVFARVVKSFGSTAMVMIARNWGKVFCFTFMAREAAKLGPIAAAAHALTFQIGFATSQVAESLATSCQVMLAQVLRKDGDADRAFHPLSVPKAGMRIVRRGLQSGFAMSIALGATTYFAQGGLLGAMTSDAPVRALASAVMPLVLICQMVKAMAYPVNGALMGALDWVYSAAALWVAGAGGVGIFALVRHLTGAVSLNKIWIGLTTFFGIQLILGIARIRSGTGPWRSMKTA